MEEILTLQEYRDGDVSIVQPIGEVDIQSMRPLREMVRRLPDEGIRFVVFDLRKVSFLDSAGMSVLFGAKKRLAEDHGECYVVTAKDGFVAKTLHTISIETVMPHLHDPEEAIADIEQRRTARAERSAEASRAASDARMAEDLTDAERHERAEEAESRLTSPESLFHVGGSL